MTTHRYVLWTCALSSGNLVRSETEFAEYAKCDFDHCVDCTVMRLLDARQYRWCRGNVEFTLLVYQHLVHSNENLSRYASSFLWVWHYSPENVESKSCRGLMLHIHYRDWRCLAMSGDERERARPPDTTTNQDRHSTQTHRGTNCMYRRVRLAKCLVCVIVAAARVDQKPARQHRAKYTHACNGTYTHRRQHTTHEAHGRRRLFHYIRAHRQRQQIFHSVQYIWSVHTGCLAIPTIVLLLVRHISIYSRFSAFRPIFFSLFFFFFHFCFVFHCTQRVLCFGSLFLCGKILCDVQQLIGSFSVESERDFIFYRKEKCMFVVCITSFAVCRFHLFRRDFFFLPIFLVY